MELRERGFKPDRYGVWGREPHTPLSGSVGPQATSGALALAEDVRTDWERHADTAAALESEGDAHQWEAAREYAEAAKDANYSEIAERVGKTRQHVRYVVTTLAVKAQPGNEGLTFAECYAKSKGGLMSSNSGDWHTPFEIVAAATLTLGEIDLDPCSNMGEPNVPAKLHYTEADDGLTKDWWGRIYMNPPYGKVIEDWVAKLAAHVEAKEVTAAVALIPARTDTAWFAHVRDGLHCFIRGRLRFSGADPAPFPSVAVYLGPARQKFVSAFGPYGDIFKRLA
jgi:phage N-6-adenine-methyltransferase